MCNRAASVVSPDCSFSTALWGGFEVENAEFGWTKQLAWLWFGTSEENTAVIVFVDKCEIQYVLHIILTAAFTIKGLWWCVNGNDCWKPQRLWVDKITRSCWIHGDMVEFTLTVAVQIPRGTDKTFYHRDKHQTSVEANDHCTWVEVIRNAM